MRFASGNIFFAVCNICLIFKVQYYHKLASSNFLFIKQHKKLSVNQVVNQSINRTLVQTFPSYFRNFV